MSFSFEMIGVVIWKILFITFAATLGFLTFVGFKVGLIPDGPGVHMVGSFWTYLYCCFKAAFLVPYLWHKYLRPRVDVWLGGPVTIFLTFMWFWLFIHTPYMFIWGSLMFGYFLYLYENFRDNHDAASRLRAAKVPFGPPGHDQSFVSRVKFFFMNVPDRPELAANAQVSSGNSWKDMTERVEARKNLLALGALGAPDAPAGTDFLRRRRLVPGGLRSVGTATDAELEFPDSQPRPAQPSDHGDVTPVGFDIGDRPIRAIVGEPSSMGSLGSGDQLEQSARDRPTLSRSASGWFGPPPS